MLKNVEVFNRLIPVSPLVVEEGKSPFQIHDISGLGPVTASVNTSDLGEIDGEAYLGSSVGKRNIVLKIGLYPDESVGQSIASLRMMLYTYFMPKTQIILRFHADHMPIVEIAGTVESCDPSLFSKEPEYTISIICPYPDFLDVSATEFSGVTIGTGEDSPILINYQGNKQTGFLLVVDATVAAPTHDGDVVVNLLTPTGSGTMLVDTVIDDSHELQIKTVVGEKFIHSNYPGSSSFENILGSLSVGSAWLQLYYGDNWFQVKSETPGQAWKLSFFSRFGGI